MSFYRRFYFLIILTLGFAALPVTAATAKPPAEKTMAGKPLTDEAQQLYQSYGDAVYQVQVIDLTSDKKTTIGSGFQFSQDGLIATNYHVVAEAIQRPNANRIEFLHDKGEKGSLTILMADVAHDLAIVKMDKPGKKWVELGTSKLSKGAKIFSFGNPHDIGFTIIEGTYNGYSRESFIEKIHFSGSLNAGMSGGPTLGHNGKVVGINVATSGNQISFLVPVEPLQALLAQYLRQPKEYSFTATANKYLQDQLLASQNKNINLLLNKKWDSVKFGPVLVPSHLHDALKCWGGINHKEADPYEIYYSICSSQDNLFLDEDFETGGISYRFDYTVGKDKLNLQRFYSLYQEQYSYPTGDYQNAKEGDVTNFDCKTNFVENAGLKWKASFCVRQYKKYPLLYDMHLYMALLGAGKKGLVATLMAQGVSQKNALGLAEKFMHEIKPSPDPVTPVPATSIPAAVKP